MTPLEKINNLETITYKGMEIQYRGFSIDNAYLFVIIETGQAIYLTKTQIKTWTQKQ